MYFTKYDVKRLELYAQNMVDYHLIVDLLPSISRLYFLNQMDIQLSIVQSVSFISLTDILTVKDMLSSALDTKWKLNLTVWLTNSARDVQLSNKLKLLVKCSKMGFSSVCVRLDSLILSVFNLLHWYTQMFQLVTFVKRFMMCTSFFCTHVVISNNRLYFLVSDCNTKLWRIWRKSWTSPPVSYWACLTESSVKWSM